MADTLGMRYLGITYPFEPNDGGRSKSLRPKEQRDCTVRCVAIAFGMTYDLAYDILAAAGRRENKGLAFRKWLGKRKTFNRFRITWESFPAEKGQRRMNPVTFAKTFKRGRFICRTAKHVYAVLDGVVQDTHPEYDERCIYGAYRLTPVTAARQPRKRRRGARRRAGAAKQARPFIGPCRDPLALWFLEFERADGQVFRTYHEDRKAARAALTTLRQTSETK